MTLREQLSVLVENTPEGVTTVTLKVDWLRRQLEAADGSGASTGEEEADRYLTTTKAARRLSVEPETVARWCRDGQFPGAFKTDPEGETGEWRIPAVDVRSMRERRNPTEDRVHFERN